MTASTLPLLALIAFLWWRTKGELLPIILFTSIFDAASALNIAGSPISPWIMALVICLPIKYLQGTLHWKPIPGINQGAYRTMLLFVGYGLFSAAVFPFLFRGIPVFNTHNGLVPLSWTFSNFAQPCYLLAALTVYLLALHSTREQLRSAVNWYIYSCVTIASISMYQLANAVLHIPYPNAILYTNTTHMIYDAYKIGGLWRLNSTLSEASAAAFYLSIGLALLGWHMATHRIRWQSAASFLLILTALILTVSTLGYATLGAMIVGGILLYIRFTFGRKGIAPVKVLLFLALIAIAVPAFLFSHAGDAIVKIFSTVFLDKVNSDSYRERSAWNEMALQSLRDSYYFGAGWGSVRASSFVCSLLGVVGIPGALLLVAFLVQAMRPLFQPKRYARLEVYERCLFGIAIMLTAMAVAGADMISPVIWVLFAVATAAKPKRVRVPAPVEQADPLPLGRPTLVA